MSKEAINKIINGVEGLYDNLEHVEEEGKIRRMTNAIVSSYPYTSDQLRDIREKALERIRQKELQGRGEKTTITIDPKRIGDSEYNPWAGLRQKRENTVEGKEDIAPKKRTSKNNISDPEVVKKETGQAFDINKALSASTVQELMDVFGGVKEVKDFMAKYGYPTGDSIKNVMQVYKIWKQNLEGIKEKYYSIDKE